MAVYLYIFLYFEYIILTFHNKKVKNEDTPIFNDEIVVLKVFVEM